MSSYDDIGKILSREYISIDVLRKLFTEEHVEKIEMKKCDKWQYVRYDVTLDNEDLYIVYVRKPDSELLKIIEEQEK